MSAAFRSLFSLHFVVLTFMVLHLVPARGLSTSKSTFVKTRNSFDTRSFWRLLSSVPANENNTEAPTRQARIAICGAGMSACVASNLLAKHGYTVDIFENGRGAGGRSSSRRHEPFLFDHGAQYIGEPKSDLFKTILAEWQKSNLIQRWNGVFATTVAINGIFSGVTEPDSSRYVGIPSMNSICRNLVEANGISTHFNNKIEVSFDYSSTSTDENCVHDNKRKVWKLFNSKTKELVGEYDWLLSGDRSLTITTKSEMELNAGNDILLPLYNDYIKPVTDSVASVPAVVCMIALSKPIPKTVLPYDGIKFKNHNTIGWIARDSSKPLRQSSAFSNANLNASGSGSSSSLTECWVVQSNPTYAQSIIDEVKKNVTKSSTRSTREEIKATVNEMSEHILLSDFKQYIQQLYDASSDVNDQYVTFEKSIVFTKGHRWGAAFPFLKSNSQHLMIGDNYYSTAHTSLLTDSNSVDANTSANGKSTTGAYDRAYYFNKSMQFAACGDYFSEQLCGRVEGAAVSGFSMANRLIMELSGVAASANINEK